MLDRRCFAKVRFALFGFNIVLLFFVGLFSPIIFQRHFLSLAWTSWARTCLWRQICSTVAPEAKYRLGVCVSLNKKQCLLNKKWPFFLNQARIRIYGIQSENWRQDWVVFVNKKGRRNFTVEHPVEFKLTKLNLIKLLICSVWWCTFVIHLFKN